MSRFLLVSLERLGSSVGLFLFLFLVVLEKGDEDSDGDGGDDGWEGVGLLEQVLEVCIHVDHDFLLLFS